MRALSRYDNNNLHAGLRSPKTVADTARCIDIRLTDNEIREMEELVADIQVPVLDK